MVSFDPEEKDRLFKQAPYIMYHLAKMEKLTSNLPKEQQYAIMNLACDIATESIQFCSENFTRDLKKIVESMGK